MEDTEEAVLWFAFREEGLLVSERERTCVPRAASLEEFGLSPTFWYDVGSLDGQRCRAAGLEPDAEPPGGWFFGTCAACGVS